MTIMICHAKISNLKKICIDNKKFHHNSTNPKSLTALRRREILCCCPNGLGSKHCSQKTVVILIQLECKKVCIFPVLISFYRKVFNLFIIRF